MVYAKSKTKPNLQLVSTVLNMHPCSLRMFLLFSLKHRSNETINPVKNSTYLSEMSFISNCHPKDFSVSLLLALNEKDGGVTTTVFLRSFIYLPVPDPDPQKQNCPCNH